MISPVEYLESYRDITVADPTTGNDIATGISVGKYLLGLKDAQTNARVALLRKIQKDLAAGKAADADYKIRVTVNTSRGWENAEFDTISSSVKDDPLWMLVRFPFAGKGSPEGIQAALQLAATDGPGGGAIVQPDRLQEYCDDLLGVDCNGFVGSYIRNEMQSADWRDLSDTSATRPDNLISSIWNDTPGTMMRSASDIDPERTNLLVLVDDSGNVIPGGKTPHGHIMISQPGEYTTTLWAKTNLGSAKGTEVPAICVTESTGAKKADGTNGLSRSWYHYIDHPQLKSKGVLLVDRGVNGSTMKVKVKALDQ